MARASRPQGYGTREELDAAIEFDYGGTVIPARPEESGYDPERRRIVRRHAAAERDAIQQLESLGFHRPWYFDAKAGTLAIAVEKFPAAVRALVDEGWHVEAEGRAFRAAKSLEMQVKSGVDWFELHGRVDFGDGRSVAIADLLAALRRGEATVILDDGTRGMVPEEWLRRYMRIAAFGESQDDHVRFRSTQTALLDALLETQPAVRIDEAFARARAELTQFSGIRPLDAAAVVSRQAARVSVRGARLVRVPAPLRLRRMPGRRHGARQDRHGARAARGAPRLAREGSAAHVGRGGAAIARLQLDRGGGPFRAGAENPRLHRRRASIGDRSKTSTCC